MLSLTMLIAGVGVIFFIIAGRPLGEYAEAPQRGGILSPGEEGKQSKRVHRDGILAYCHGCLSRMEFGYQQLALDLDRVAGCRGSVRGRHVTMQSGS